MLKGIECLNPRLQSLVAPLQSVRINALPYLFLCMPAIRVLPQPCCMFKALRMDLCQELLHSRCLYCRSITHSTRKTGASSLSMEDVRILSPLLSPPSPRSTAGNLQMSGNSATMFGLSALRCKHSDFGYMIGVAIISST